MFIYISNIAYLTQRLFSFHLATPRCGVPQAQRLYLSYKYVPRRVFGLKFADDQMRGDNPCISSTLKKKRSGGGPIYDLIYFD